KKEKQLSPIERKMNDFVTDYLTHIPLIQKIFFVEHMHTMVHAGLSLVESLETLAKEIENKKLRKIIGEIKQDIEKGQPLGQVLAKYPKAFPPIYVKMIEAGEIAGKLEESLKQVVSQMKKNSKLISSVRGAMIYPAVVITAMVAIGIMMVTVVLPKLTILFQEFDAELPLATRVLIVITDFASQPKNLIMIIIGLVAIIILFSLSLKKYPKFRRTIHNLNLHLPIFGRIIKKINLARFSLTLSSLLQSAIPIVQAVEITGDTCGNVLYRDYLKNTAEKIKTGTPLSEILREADQLFPPMVTEMIMVGERTGEIDQLLDELANFYSEEVDKTMKNFTTIIEPVIILLLGLAVAGIAVAVIMPMYTLVQAF
ncbi:MAG: type II secretion system F family protein, partial [Candidatus Magasanikbacteria bacterium]